ncbi:MAG: hypothetical protein VX498_11325 [Myxococcota bacterium]|nr:hypothetical protein [Myxococcota bacterium]
MIGGLIQVFRLGDAAQRDFSLGRKSLWGLVPPIDALQIQEAGLELPGVRSLSVAVMLWGQHALHHYLPSPGLGIPPLLADVEYVAEALVSALDRAGDEPGSSSRRRLRLLLDALEARSPLGLGEDSSDVHMEIPRRKAKENPERVESEGAHARESYSAPEPTAPPTLAEVQARAARQIAVRQRIVLALVFLPLLASLHWILPRAGGGLPPVSDYREVPLVAMIRMPGTIKVRVHSSWFTVSEEERSDAVKELWKRLTLELDDEGLELTVTDNVNVTRGGVVAGRVWWENQR